MEGSVFQHLKPVLLWRRTQKHPQRCPEDRAVLKTLTARLAHILPSSPACMHLRGHGGLTFRDITRGIPGGCSLSPLMGAFHLHAMDVAMTTRHARCFYIRYMDDILILAPSRWQLRRAIATMNQQLEALGLTQHPDKTTIGPVARGFDFLGYQFDPAGLSLSVVTRSRHQEKLTRLYERYHRQLRAYRSGWIGPSTIQRTHYGAQA
jgi:hypothetical protein